MSWKLDGSTLARTSPWGYRKHVIEDERAILQSFDQSGLDVELDCADETFDAIMGMVADVMGDRVHSITIDSSSPCAAYATDLRRFPNMREFVLERSAWNYDLVMWVYRELARHPSIAAVTVYGGHAYKNGKDVLALLAKPGLISIMLPLPSVIDALTIAADHPDLQSMTIETPGEVDYNAVHRILRVSRSIDAFEVFNNGRLRIDGNYALDEARTNRLVFAFMTALLGPCAANRFLKCDGDNAIMTRVVQCLLDTKNVET